MRQELRPFDEETDWSFAPARKNGDLRTLFGHPFDEHRLVFRPCKVELGPPSVQSDTHLMSTDWSFAPAKVERETSEHSSDARVSVKWLLAESSRTRARRTRNFSCPVQLTLSSERSRHDCAVAKNSNADRISALCFTACPRTGVLRSSPPPRRAPSSSRKTSQQRNSQRESRPRSSATGCVNIYTDEATSTQCRGLMQHPVITTTEIPVHRIRPDAARPQHLGDPTRCTRHKRRHAVWPCRAPRIITMFIQLLSAIEEVLLLWTHVDSLSVP